MLLTPGANVVLVSQLAASGDRRAALAAATGITVVAAIWATLAVLGINALMVAVPTVSLGIQMAGGLYLLYVASRLMRSATRTQSDARNLLSTNAAFRLGLLTNILNPKTALFFGSMFAAALPASAPPLQLAAVVGLVVVNALAWHVLLALTFSQERARRTYARLQSLLNRVAGALVGLFGLRMLWTAALGIPGP